MTETTWLTLAFGVFLGTLGGGLVVGTLARWRHMDLERENARLRDSNQRLADQEHESGLDDRYREDEDEPWRGDRHPWRHRPWTDEGNYEGLT